MWEERIVPALFELEKTEKMFKDWFVLEEMRTLVIGTDPDIRQKLESNFARSLPGEPAATICSFRNIKDLSILRRLKDYPDETPANEILAPWTGWCKELNAVIIVNG